jgi:thioredoxin-related protein
MIKTLIFSLLLLTSAPLWGASLYTIKLDNLREIDTVTLSEYKDKLLIISVFEPECPWCLKQFKAVEKLYRNCAGEIQPIAVGVGSKQKLKSLVYRAKISFPALEASPDFMSLIGNPTGTPFTLIIDQQGNLVTTLQGYIPYEKLSYAFQDTCSA